MKSKLLVTALLLGLFIPNMVFAAWWKPTTWKIFKKTQKTEIVIEKNATTTEKTTKVEPPKIQNTTKSEDSEISFLKKQIEELSKKATQPNVVDKIQTSTITLPSGAIAEIDVLGNITRMIKETPQQTYLIPAPIIQTTSGIQISSINITPTITTAKIEWQTDKPTESKVFLSGGGLSSKIYNSESGLSTRHSVSVSSLKGATTYWYEIEAITNGSAYKKTGSFLTETPPPVPSFVSTPAITLVEKGVHAEKLNVFSAYVVTNIPTIMVFSATNARCEISVFATVHTCQVSVPVNYHPFSIVITSEKGVTNRFDGRFDQIIQ